MSRADREAAFSLFLQETPWDYAFTTHPPHDETPLECVIVEPRICPRLVPVLCNMSAMIPAAAITVFHSAENAYLFDDVRGQAHGIRFIEFTKGNITRDEYSSLLTSVEFWDQLIAPKILIFQTDSAIRFNDILRYMQYDYIGAPWNWTVANDPRIEIGNGGFSLRSRALFREICANFARDPDEAEDVFFARYLIDMPGVVLPDKITAAEFSFEHAYIPDTSPMAFHQAYLHQPIDIVTKLFTEGVDLGGAVPDDKKIIDAWIEEPNGHIIREYIICGEVWPLHKFLALGLTAKKLRISPDTYFGSVENSVLHIQFNDKTDSFNIKI